MKASDSQLTRLLRAASDAPGPGREEMPFGFDSRVLAGWRDNLKGGDLVDLGRLLRRVVLLSLGVILLSSAGLYNDLRQSDDLADEYAIADNAIGSAFEQ